MNKRLYYSVALLSSSIVAFQLSLMHMLSAVQWNHFAYMVISVALLGFGASGTLLFIAREWFIRKIRIILYLLVTGTGIFMSGVIFFSYSLFGKFDTFLLFNDLSHVYYLLISYFAFFIPFFSGGLALGLIYIFNIKKISYLYFADLFGSGAGGIIILGLLWIFYPAQLPSFIAAFPIVAGILIIPDGYFKRLIIPSLVFLLIPLYLLVYPPSIPVSEYKDISRTRNLPDSEIYIEKESPYGHIQVVRSSYLRYAPGLSLNFSGEVPVHDVIFNNGNWYGPVVGWSETDTAHILNFTTQNLPYLFNQHRNVVILDSGTGLSASHALQHNSEKVICVEPNEVIVDLLKNEPGIKSAGLFAHPRLQIVIKSSRSFLLSDTALYDLIILPTIESFGGSSGINALKEQYIFTAEGIKDIWDRLNPEGMIAVTSWIDYPFRNPLKILATLIETFETTYHSDIEKHLVAIRSWGTISFVLKKSPLSEEEISSIKSFCHQMFFDPVFLPGMHPDERLTYNQIQDERFFFYLDRLLTSDRDQFYHEYDFNIRPSTDNKPYFSQFLKLNRLSKLIDLFGQGTVPYLELGYVIVLFTFIQIALAAILLIILPLMFTGWKGGGKIYTLLHFSGIGIGFMFVEIIFIQKFILYFGNPIYAASAVLSGMLLCSGIGSLFSTRLKNSHKGIVIILMIVILLLFTYSIILTPLLRFTINLPFILKIVFSILVIGPLAFFMGIPFPLGLNHLENKNPAMIPWAWGVNGCLSVISTVLATIIAVESGFFYVLIIAGIAYGIVLTVNIPRLGSHADT